jgi:YVTN family beta-propeller protein
LALAGRSDTEDLTVHRRIILAMSAAAVAAITATGLAGAPGAAAGSAPAARAARPTPRPAAARQVNAYVANNQTGTVTVFNTATDNTLATVNVGGGPEQIAVTPDGKTAYVLNGTNAVTPIDTATNKAGHAIPLGATADFIAITPNGKTAYVTTGQAKAGVVPINTATNTAGTPIRGTGQASLIAIAPNGKTAYVDGVGGRCGIMSIVTVRPIHLATNTVGAATGISCRGTISDIAITPNSRTAEVVSYLFTFGHLGGVTSINVATNRVSGSVSTDRTPVAIAITP